VLQLLRERSLAQQILDPRATALPDLPFSLVFIKVNVTARRRQIAAREQMSLVRTRHRPGNRGQYRCFDVITEDLKDIREAADEQSPVYINDPYSQNSQLYQQMTDEFLRHFP